MRRIRVLIVDDAAAVRKLLTEALAGHPGLQVVGTAPDGRAGLARIQQLQPDLVVLDLEMPVLDGLGMLAEMRRERLRLPVVMFSRLTRRGASATLDALALGASDYVMKPSAGSVAAAIGEVRDQLVPKILELGRRALSQGPAGAADPVRVSAGRSPLARARARVGVVAIGASTGGPNALGEIIPALPADFPAPIVVVQHMPPIFTKHLAERLDSKSALRVAEAHDGVTLAPGEVWIAPGDMHLVVERDGTAARLRLHQGPRVHSCRPAVDELFLSVVPVFGSATLAVLLTGMGQDGAAGCERIRAAEGTVIVQDEATSVVWGMPGRVATSGHADAILPLEDIAAEIVRISRGGASDRLQAA